MMSGFVSPTHMMVLLVVVLLLFGAKRLPETGHSLGRSLRGFKQGLDGKDPEHPELPPE